MEIPYTLEILKDSEDLTEILSKETDKIKKRIKAQQTKSNLSDLEKRLNTVFYPPEGKTHSIQTYYNEQLEKLVKRYEATIEEKLQSYDFSKEPNKNFKPSESGKINKSTLLKEIEYLEDLMKEINEKGIKDIPKVLEFAENAKKILQDKANQKEITKIFGEERIDSDDNIVNIINQVRSLKHFLEQNVKSQKEFGDLFENVLALINYKEIENGGQINEDIDELIKKYIFGDKTVLRGSTGEIQMELPKELYDKEKYPDFELKDDKYIMRYNPSEKRQGKLDVLINFEDPTNQQYRISAKNWSKGSADLGKISIDYGINRIGSYGSVYAYKYAILLEDDAVEKAHRFAKLALKADIAMGLSQTYSDNNRLGGYANVLVINDPAHNRIVVEDLAKIVLEMVSDSNKDLYPLSGYDESDIEAKAKSHLEMIKIKNDENRSKSYISIITSTLQKMIVTMNLSTNSLINNRKNNNDDI